MVIFGIDSCLILYTHSNQHGPKEMMDEELGKLSIKDLVSSHCLVHHQQQHSPQEVTQPNTPTLRRNALKFIWPVID
jgi:hypothetical protein